MADPITWYTLPRKIDDLTTIEEMIDKKILEHNLDPSAHGQSDEALYNHRINAELDHVNYSIYNIKLNPNTRTIKAFVDKGGAAEFRDIQEAINYVNSEGGGRIYIKEGTYHPTSDINLYSNIYIEGEDRDTVIIDFQYSQYKIKAKGTPNNHLHNIKIENIQITRAYNSDENYIEMEYVDDADILNCKFYYNQYTQPWQQAYLTLKACTQINIKYNYFQNTAGVRAFNNCVSVIIAENLFKTINLYAVWIESGSQSVVRDNTFDGEMDELMTIHSEGAIITGNTIKNVDGIGITVDVDNAIISNNVIEAAVPIVVGYPGTKAIITNNRVKATDGDAINLLYTFNCVVDGNICDATGAGVYINDVSQYNLVSNNNVRGASDGIVDEGGNNLIVNNME